MGRAARSMKDAECKASLGAAFGVYKYSATLGANERKEGGLE